MDLPADSDVHSEWSWDAPGGDMIKTCILAEEFGLPAVAFTEHLDHTTWQVARDGLEADHLLVRLSDRDGVLVPPIFDVAGYLNAAEECRARFLQLRILTAVELGEPHRHPVQVAQVLRDGHFDRVLGSVHTLADRGGYTEPPGMFTHLDPACQGELRPAVQSKST